MLRQLRLQMLRHRPMLIVLATTSTILLLLLVLLIRQANSGYHTQPPSTEPGNSHQGMVPLNTLMGSYARYPSATGTPLTTVAKNDSAETTSTTTPAAAVPDQCELVYFTAVVRHGTRNPSLDELDDYTEMEQTLQRLRLKRKNAWPDWLLRWRSPYTTENTSHLVRQGEQDLQQLAQRTIERYSRWVAKDPSERHNSTRYSTYDKLQIVASMQMYAQIFSGRQLSNDEMHLEAMDQSKELAIIKACPRWKELNDQHKESSAVMAPLKARYKEVHLRQLRRRLGVKLPKHFIKQAVNACWYEYAIEQQAHRWCQLLEPSLRDSAATGAPPLVRVAQDSELDTAVDLPGGWVSPLQLADYQEDVNRYYKAGAGRAMNRCLAAPLLRHIVQEMQTAYHNQSTPLRWHIRVGHTATILLPLTLLGLYTEMPRLEDAERAFRTSQLIPFGANLHFELLRCAATATADSDAFQVRVLLNEQPIRLPGCPPDTDLCPYLHFQHLLRQHTRDCNFDHICRAKSKR